MKLALSALLLSASFAAPMLAQATPDTPPPPPAGMHHDGPGGPHGPRFGRPFAGPMHSERALPITNSPFTAQFTATGSFTDRDGKQVQRTSSSTVYRDSQGRVREDITLPPPPPRPASASTGEATPVPPATPGTLRVMTVILDPVAHTITRLNANRKTAHVETVPSDFFTRMVQREQRHETNTVPRSDASLTDLGHKVIAGVPVKGERITHTLPAAAGEAAQTNVRERWFSPDVKLEAASSDTSPRMSRSDTLTSFSKAEPSADLFKVPAGYTVQNEPEHGFHGRHAGPGEQGGPGMDAPPPPPAM